MNYLENGKDGKIGVAEFVRVLEPVTSVDMGRTAPINAKVKQKLREAVYLRDNVSKGRCYRFVGFLAYPSRNHYVGFPIMVLAHRVFKINRNCCWGSLKHPINPTAR